MASIRQRVAIPLQMQDVHCTAEFVTFDGLEDSREHLALVMGAVDAAGITNVRVHSECLTGDVFGSCRCDCGPQLQEAMAMFAAEGGILLYLRHEGRGIGLYNKLDAYALQDRGHDTFEANEALGFPRDSRDFAVAAQMLRALGVGAIRLVSNNPDKAGQLQEMGIRVAQVVPTRVHVNPHNRAYLETKRSRAAHTIEWPAATTDGEPGRTGPA